MAWHQAVVIPRMVTLADELKAAASRGELVEVFRDVSLMDAALLRERETGR